MEAATHIIGRQSLQLRYRGNTDVPALRNMLSQLCAESLPKHLDNLFSRYDQDDQVLRIDRLHVNISLRDTEDLEGELARAIIEQTEAQLIKALTHGNGTTVRKSKSFTDALLFYLAHGFLPWWLGGLTKSEFQTALAESWQGASLQQIVQETAPMLASAQIRSRFLSMLDTPQFEAWVLATGRWQQEAWKAFKDYVKRASGERISEEDNATFEFIWKNVVLETIYASANTDQAISRLQARLEQHKARKGSLDQLPLTNRPSEVPFNDANDEREDARLLRAPADGDAIYVCNAGLVLLAPYLPTLFRNTGMIKSGIIQNIPRAIALLRYLVYEDAGYEEYEVVLEKILCGLPLTESIDWRHNISAEEMDEADGLLQSAIGHWTALKGTSPAGLREGFLKREGRLSLEAGQWELKVQKKAQDVLLDFLPWSFNMIRLQWMEQLLIVKWNT